MISDPSMINMCDFICHVFQTCSSSTLDIKFRVSSMARAAGPHRSWESFGFRDTIKLQIYVSNSTLFSKKRKFELVSNFPCIDGRLAAIGSAAGESQILCAY